jgi:bifunctional non-homologous end joining protein LigD
VLLLARLHRDALAHLGVRGQPKVTGRRGIQIWIPVAAGTTFEQTRSRVEGLCMAVVSVVPGLVSWSWAAAGRHGLARLDYTQNSPAKTLVAPYSPWAVAGAPVSAPIRWDELDEPGLRPDGFTIWDMPERLARVGDLFGPMLADGQRLSSLG